MSWPPPMGYGMPMPPMGYPPGAVPGMRPPMPSPFMRPPMVHPGIPATVVARPPVPVVPDKQLQAYVGKIPEGVADGFIKNLLEQCGGVAKWERVTDPTSGNPKPFGFCKFMGADSVLRALRLLNGIEIDDGALLLKVDQKTQAFLDEHEAEQRLAAAQGGEAAAQETEKDTNALKTIQELITNRAATVAATNKESKESSERREREKREASEREAERLEKERDRERDRERRREREEEAQFRDRERDWERRESDKFRDKDREAEREKMKEKDRERRIADCEDAEETDFETWWAKYQDRSYARKRARDREADDDDADRRREKDEEEEERKANEGTKSEGEEEEDAKGSDIKERDDDHGAVKLTFGVGGKKGSKQGGKAVFDKEEEEVKKMKLTPIEYTEEEKRAREALAKPEVQKTAAEKEAEMKRPIMDILMQKDYPGLTLTLP